MRLWLGFRILFFILIVSCLLTGSFLSRLTTALGVETRTFVSILLGKTFSLNRIDGYVHFLILGMGGPSHEGGDLTDTMLLVSYNTGTNTLTSMSLPRDIWSDTLKDKINSAYHYGEENESGGLRPSEAPNEVKSGGGGMKLTKMIVKEITGIELSYIFTVDFSGFEKLIDEVGGVDINVPDTFTDATYPIAGKENDLCEEDSTYACRYMSVTFTKGIEHMSGERALVYVRSRYADGEQGSDFARGDRQQQVITAIQKKLSTAQTYFPPSKIFTLITLMGQMVQSDMSIDEQLSFVREYGMRLRKATTRNITLEEQFVNPDNGAYDGRYVLVPKTSWEEVKEYVKGKL